MTETPSPYIVPDDLPCIYADDVANLSSESGVFKFYLTRRDPGPHSDVLESTRAVAQVVMPKKKLIELAIFFRQTIAELDAEGTLFDDRHIRERLKSLDLPSIAGNANE